MEILKALISDTFFISLFPVGIIFWIVGKIVKERPPKKINHFYGYRTKRSMKSQEAWDFSQDYNSELMKQAGLILMVISLLGPMIEFSPELGIGLSMAVIFGAVGFIIYKTENALIDKFGK